MRKISEFLVNKRYIVLTVVILLTIFSATLFSKVNIITDMTEFLPDDSQMKIGIDLMKEEFPDLEESKYVKVMSTDLDDSSKLELVDKLESIENVESVSYRLEDEDYNKDNHSLFLVNTEVDYDSEEFTAIMDTINNDLSTEYNLVTATGEEDTPEVPASIMIFAVIIILVILFLMCASWVEPFLFMTAIGFAVIINMGTNAFFAGVSETTYSIVAMLQLVLSMDYSIILTNRYRQELALGKEKEVAMKDALVQAFAPISSSSLTTVVGLLALVFMSFKIGPDMGIVLAKGVFISMLSILTVLPALILIFDNAIKKTEKKILHIPMGRLSRFSFRNKKVFSIMFVIFFASMYILKDNMGISYLMFEYNEIDEVFPPVNNILVLYNNNDEEQIATIGEELSENENVKKVQSYSTTFGKKQTAAEMYEFILDQDMKTDQAFDESMIDLIYYDYFHFDDVRKLSLNEFTTFVDRYTTEHPDFVSEEEVQQMKQFSMFTSKEELLAERSAAEIAGIFGMDEQVVSQVLMMSQKTTISIVDFLTVIQNTPQLALGLAQASPEAAQQMQGLSQIIQATMTDKLFTAQELDYLFKSMGSQGSFDEGSLNLLYEMYYSEFTIDESQELTIEELFEHLIEMANDEYYASAFDDEIRADLETYSQDLEDGKEQLIGPNYSIMLIESYLPEESELTNELFGNLLTKFNENLSNDYYFIGNTPMEYELTMTFDDELTKITILTALAIFVVVMLTFKNVAIPIILISLIQSAVYATMVIMSATGDSMNFLALLIVQSILMGATTDYAILFVNYYREKRQILGAQEALTEAYNHSIHTIFTSGLIMVLVTWIVGYAFEDPAIRQICHTISLGATCAIILILFVLPSLVASFDKWTSGLKIEDK